MGNKKRTKLILKKIVKLGYWLVLFACAFIVAGTLLFFIPLLSDIASMAFLPAYPYIFVLCVLLAVGGIIFYLRKKSARRLGVLIAACSVLFFFLFISFFMIAKINAQGEHIHLFRAFIPQSYSKIVQADVSYVDQNEHDIPLSVIYEDDGKKNKPVIFYTHGGGWISGSRFNRLDTTKAFAKNGYIVVCADYDLSDEEVHLYSFTEKQLLHAVRWCEENISAYGGDMNRFYMVGDSAGGNLVLNLAYKINSGEYASYPAVTAVSVIYPVVDIRDFYENDNLLMASAGKKMAVSYMGSIPSKEAGRYAEHNPENYLSAATPPTLMVLGTNDSLVPPGGTYRFAKELNEKGIENQLIKVPFANHAGDINANNFMGQAYINKTLAWFHTYH